MKKIKPFKGGSKNLFFHPKKLVLTLMRATALLVPQGCRQNGVFGGALKFIRKGIDLYREILTQPFRIESLREMQHDEDFLLVMLFSEQLGIPNPVYWYTLEMYPYLMENYHAWHIRMGMEKSPFHGIKCC
jgi:hypothetical protein